MIPKREGGYFLGSGWRLSKPFAGWKRSDFYGHGGRVGRPGLPDPPGLESVGPRNTRFSASFQAAGPGLCRRGMLVG